MWKMGAQVQPRISDKEEHKNSDHPEPGLFYLRSNESADCERVAGVRRGDSVTRFLCQLFDVTHPIRARLMKEQLASNTDHVYEDQDQQRSDAHSLIDCPIQERDDDQIELYLPKKGKEIHESVQCWTHGLHRLDQGYSELLQGFHEILL